MSGSRFAGGMICPLAFAGGEGWGMGCGGAFAVCFPEGMRCELGGMLRIEARRGLGRWGMRLEA